MSEQELNEALETIKQIIITLKNNPAKKVESDLGSGCHARAYGENNQFHKIVIPGDTFDMVETQLHYLLYDLAIDCKLSDTQLKTLEYIGR